MAYEPTVEGGGAAFADFEEACIRFKSFDMRSLCQALVKEGKITEFEAIARAAEFEGMTANFLGQTWAMHLALTRKA